MYQITDEEYQKAQLIIEAYHMERQQQAEWDLEDDEPDQESEEDYIERLEEERFERQLELVASCSCGAWVMNKDKTKVLHVADCICGAE